jgi:hypothetical protein
MNFSEVDLSAIGHELVMVGAVYQGSGLAFLAMFPDEWAAEDMQEVNMTMDDWHALLRQADLLEREVEVNEEDGTVRKAILRKSARQIDQNVSWAVFRRDGYTCRYCGRSDAPLSVDHLVLWEDRGPSTMENLVTACKKCNRTRGRKSYAEWLLSPYYQRVAAALTVAQRAANAALEATLASVPLVHRQRSR